MGGRPTVWREAKAGLLKSLPITGRIGSKLTIDFVIDLPESNNCTKFMVIIDRLSNDVFLFVTSSIEAVKCAELFIDRYYRFFGFPPYSTGDKGSGWLSHFWKTFCQLMGIMQKLTTSYNLQRNASGGANQELY